MKMNSCCIYRLPRACAVFRIVIAVVLAVACLFVGSASGPGAAAADRRQWTTYALPPSEAQSRISFLSVDPGGYVWFGLSAPDQTGEGLGVLDAMGEYIFPFTSTHARAVRQAAAVAFEPVPEDFSDEGAIWIGAGSSLLVADRSGRTTVLTSRNSPLPPGRVREVYIARDNTRWIAVSGRGVACVDAEFNWAAYNRTSGLGSDYIDVIFEDRRGNLWFGTTNRGVSRLDRHGNWIRFTASNSALISNRITGIAEEKPGRLWFVTPDGISVFDGANWTSYTPRNSPLGRAPVTSLVIDTAGNKWIGTDGAGLLKLDGFGRWSEYTVDNSQLPDNRIARMTADGQGTLWLATPAGITSLSSGTRMPADTERVYTPGAPGPVYTFEQALHWQADDERFSHEVELSWALPSLPFGGRAWYFGALWVDAAERADALDFALIADRRGSQRLQLRGDFSQARLLLNGALLLSDGPQEIPGLISPFPDRMPEDVAGYLLPGEHIPSGDPAVAGQVARIVRPESRNDMYATLRDIVYSDYVQMLQPAEVLNAGNGNQHERARAVCSLARAAGLPARLVMDIHGSVWCQAWAARRGWISIESMYPVFDYVQPVRTGMPKRLTAREHVVAVLSGRDDTLSRLSWNSELSAVVQPVVPAEIRQPEQLRTARILLALIHDEGPVPQQARIPLADAISVHARQRGTHVQLVFEDPAGRELHTITPDLQGLAGTVTVRDRLFWRFIARRLGHMLIIENIDCFEYLPGE